MPGRRVQSCLSGNSVYYGSKVRRNWMYETVRVLVIGLETIIAYRILGIPKT